MSELSQEHHEKARILEFVESPLRKKVERFGEFFIERTLNVSQSTANKFLGESPDIKINLKNLCNLIYKLGFKLIGLDENILPKGCVSVPYSVVISAYKDAVSLYGAESPQVRQYKCKLIKEGIMIKLNGKYYINEDY